MFAAPAARDVFPAGTLRKVKIMKIITKFTYILLILALLLGAVPFGVLAEGEDTAAAVTETDSPESQEPDVNSTDAFEYTVSADGFATITAYSGEGNFVAIPEALGGYPVTAIGEGVFADRGELCRVLFSEGLISIGADAFRGCTALESVILPHSLTHIGESAFEGCSSLYRADFGKSLISLGDKAFYGCAALDGVSLPATLTSVGEEAFADCTALLDVLLASTTATLPASVFGGSTAVTVYAPAGAAALSSGGAYATAVAAGAEAFQVKDTAGGLEITDIIGEPQAIIIPEYANGSIVALDNYALALLPSLRAVHIPDTVINIGKTAFKEDVSLGFVRMPRWVQSNPGQEMFSGCTSLRRIFLPEGMETVGMSSFHNCAALALVAFPEDIIRIKSGAFFGCSALETLIFEGDAPECAMMGGSVGSVIMGSAPADMKVYVSADRNWPDEWRPNGGSPYLAYTVVPREYDCFYVEVIITPLSCAADGLSALVCPLCGHSFDRIYPKYPHNFVSVGMGNGVESFRCTACTENYTVNRLEIAEITAEVDYIYSGVEMIRSVAVEYRGVTLTEGVDYTKDIEYSPQKSRLTVTVTGMGEYAGSRRAAYSSLTGNKLKSYTLTVVGASGNGEYFRDDIVEIYPNAPIPEGMEAVWTVDGTKLRQGDNNKATIEMPAHDVTVTLGYRRAVVTTPPVTTPPEPDDTTTPPEDVTTTPPEELDPPITTPAETDPPFGGTAPARELMGRAALFAAILLFSLAGFVVMCIFMFKKDIKKKK